jgi:hypothetical protein
MAGEISLWLPLASTIAGGAIALVSAHLAARYQTTATLKREKLERRLKKAEELYDLILKVEHLANVWSLAVEEKDVKLLTPDFDFSEREIKKIGMIVDIYIPELGDNADTLLSDWDKYGKLVVRCMGLKQGKKADESVEHECQAAHKLFRAATRDFKKHISRAVTDMA